MALPTTNLTAHFDASAATHVIKTGSTTGVDGDNIEEWEDNDAKDLSLWYPVTSAEGPTYKTATPLMLASCLDFNGTSECLKLYNSAGTVQKELTDIFAVGAKTLILSLYIKSASLNDANAWNNHGIFTEVKQLFGLHLRTSGGLYYLQAYNWDGSEDKAEVQVLLNTSYVVTLRHDGTSIYLGLDGGTETSVASGNSTASFNRYLFLGVNGSGVSAVAGTAFADIRIGEIATWNAALTSTALTDANAYFTSKWLPVAGGIIPRIMHHRKLMRVN